MVSRQETPRPLLTPGEVLQLPPGDQLVLMSGCPPLRAKKVRYVEDRRFTDRVLPPSQPGGGGRWFETILCARLSPLQPYAVVFLVDLIRFVLFLIDPVGCNDATGGVIDLNLKPNSRRSRAEGPLARLTPATGLT
jgi:hypothetical protein